MCQCMLCENENQGTIMYRINSDNCELETHNSTEEFWAWHKLQMWSLGGFWCSITGSQKKNQFPFKVLNSKFVWFFFSCSTREAHFLYHFKQSVPTSFYHDICRAPSVFPLSCKLMDRNSNTFHFQTAANWHLSCA